MGRRSVSSLRRFHPPRAADEVLRGDLSVRQYLICIYRSSARTSPLWIIEGNGTMPSQPIFLPILCVCDVCEIHRFERLIFLRFPFRQSFFFNISKVLYQPFFSFSAPSPTLHSSHFYSNAATLLDFTRPFFCFFPLDFLP